MRKSSVDIFRRYLSAQSIPAVEEPSIPKPAITISRETGAGAVTVAHLVAQQLEEKQEVYSLNEKNWVSDAGKCIPFK